MFAHIYEFVCACVRMCVHVFVCANMCVRVCGRGRVTVCVVRACVLMLLSYNLFHCK